MLELPSSQVKQPTWGKEIKYWRSLLISKLNSFKVTVDHDFKALTGES